MLFQTVGEAKLTTHSPMALAMKGITVTQHYIQLSGYVGILDKFFHYIFIYLLHIASIIISIQTTATPQN